MRTLTQDDVDELRRWSTNLMRLNVDGPAKREAKHKIQLLRTVADFIETRI